MKGTHIEQLSSQTEGRKEGEGREGRGKEEGREEGEIEGGDGRRGWREGERAGGRGQHCTQISSHAPVNTLHEP